MTKDKSIKDQPPEPKSWEESFSEKFGDVIRMEVNLHGFAVPKLPSNPREELRAFIRKVEQEAYERGKREENASAIKIVKHLHWLSESGSAKHECSQEGYEYGLEDVLKYLTPVT